MSKTILVCDDDEGILDMLEFVLEDFGFNIVPEKNSLNIYQTIKKEQPDLVLLDLWMPVLSGDQVLRTLRSNPETAELPVIVISASRDGKQIAESSGANAFVSKPFDMDQLINQIENFIS